MADEELPFPSLVKPKPRQAVFLLEGLCQLLHLIPYINSVELWMKGEELVCRLNLWRKGSLYTRESRRVWQGC